jgi:glycosyltransferase involved in cell wall biosynthesis
MGTAPKRPAVSVVVPFRGSRGDAEGLRTALERLAPGANDELIVADNSEDGRGADLRDLARVVPATAERSSYHARNAGAAAASREWLLFMDADCEPSDGLLDAYFAEPIGERVGAIAGEIVGDPTQDALAARYARSRKVLSQTDGLYGRGRVVAATGNLLVRSSAFHDLGGFREGIRSGGDVDFCLRLPRRGWKLAFRPGALVRHRHRERVLGLMPTFTRYAAGSRWLNEQYPGISGRWPLPKQFALAWVDAARDVARGEREEAAFRAIDACGLLAHNVGYRMGNRVGSKQ